MPFRDGSFDAAFAFDATCHSPSLERVYREVHRVLKPGGTWGTTEWVLTLKFDPSHQALAHVAMRKSSSIASIAFSNPPHQRYQAREAFLNAGFDIVHEQDYARHLNYSNGLAEMEALDQPPVLIPYKDSTRPAPPAFDSPPRRPPALPILDVPASRRVSPRNNLDRLVDVL